MCVSRKCCVVRSGRFFVQRSHADCIVCNWMWLGKPQLEEVKDHEGGWNFGLPSLLRHSAQLERQSCQLNALVIRWYSFLLQAEWTSGVLKAHRRIKSLEHIEETHRGSNPGTPVLCPNRIWVPYKVLISVHKIKPSAKIYGAHIIIYFSKIHKAVWGVICISGQKQPGHRMEQRPHASSFSSFSKFLTNHIHSNLLGHDAVSVVNRYRSRRSLMLPSSGFWRSKKSNNVVLFSFCICHFYRTTPYLNGVVTPQVVTVWHRPFWSQRLIIIRTNGKSEGKYT
jgi:hypothetical protein